MGVALKRIAIDMDEVLSHFSRKCVELFNEEFYTTYTSDDLQGKKLNELDARFEHKLHEYLRHESFFLDLEVVRDSQEVIRNLCCEYEIFIVTAAMEFPSSLAPKYKWLKKHFPFLDEKNFVFCGDKSIIRADFLIDDTVSNFDNFHGKGLLFTAPHNLNITDKIRMNSWKDIEDYFLAGVQI